MDELTLYSALDEKTTATHCPKAAHVRGPEALHRPSPDLYDSSQPDRLRVIAEESHLLLCLSGCRGLLYCRELERRN